MTTGRAAAVVDMFVGAKEGERGFKASLMQVLMGMKGTRRRCVGVDGQYHWIRMSVDGDENQKNKKIEGRMQNWFRFRNYGQSQTRDLKQLEKI